LWGLWGLWWWHVERWNNLEPLQYLSGDAHAKHGFLGFLYQL
jgi:hypothetical protein